MEIAVYVPSGYSTRLEEDTVDLVQAILLALVQGITEFLPISSSAHLVLPSEVLGWPDQGLAFDTAVHLGSLTAVIAYFWKDLIRLFTAGFNHVLLQKKSEDGTYAVNLLIASIPVIIMGYLSRFLIEEHLRSMEVIAATTIIFGLALWYADTLKGEGEQALTAGRALTIGFAQCLALIPGTSRSGITITAALMMGFSRTEAARISFLISIPTILGAGTLKLIDLVTQSGPVDWVAIGLGTAVSGISAYICITLFLSFIEKIGLLPFVIYRLILGAILIVIML